MAYGWSREGERHWREVARPMPRLRTTIRAPDRYPKEAFDRLFSPRLPGEMEDKWIALPGLEETVIDFHRSWTGFHLYRVYLFEDEDGSWYVDRVDVNRDPEQYRCTDDAYDADVVRWLVRALVLGEPVEFPLDPSLPHDDALLAAWSLGGAVAFEPPADGGADARRGDGPAADEDVGPDATRRPSE